jgi:hypothetical protein
LGLAISVSWAVSWWRYEKWLLAMLFERLAARNHMKALLSDWRAPRGNFETELYAKSINGAPPRGQPASTTLAT